MPVLFRLLVRSYTGINTVRTVRLVSAGPIFFQKNVKTPNFGSFHPRVRELSQNTDVLVFVCNIFVSGYLMMLLDCGMDDWKVGGFSRIFLRKNRTKTTLFLSLLKFVPN